MTSAMSVICRILSLLTPFTVELHCISGHSMTLCGHSGLLSPPHLKLSHYLEGMDNRTFIFKFFLSVSVSWL